MNYSYKGGEENDPNREEVAFYDAIASHNAADDILMVIAHKLAQAKKNEPLLETYANL